MKHTEYCILVNGYLCDSTFDEKKAGAIISKLSKQYPNNTYTIKACEYTEAQYQKFFVRGEE